MICDGTVCYIHTVWKSVKNVSFWIYFNFCAKIREKFILEYLWIWRPSDLNTFGLESHQFWILSDLNPFKFESFQIYQIWPPSYLNPFVFESFQIWIPSDLNPFSWITSDLAQKLKWDFFVDFNTSCRWMSFHWPWEKYPNVNGITFSSARIIKDNTSLISGLANHHLSLLKCARVLYSNLIGNRSWNNCVSMPFVMMQNKNEPSIYNFLDRTEYYIFSDFLIFRIFLTFKSSEFCDFLEILIFPIFEYSEFCYFWILEYSKIICRFNNRKNSGVLENHKIPKIQISEKSEF